MRTSAYLLLVAGISAVAYAHGPEENTPGNVKSIKKYGVYGRDFFYYRPETTAKVVVDDGVKISSWDAGHNKTVDIVVAQPFITKLEFPAGANGKSFPKSSFWLRDDTSYVVISGNATFGNTSNPVHGYGDVFWVMGGSPHGPIFNVGDTPLVMLAVGMPYEPQFGDAPSWYNPSVNWYLTYERSYRRVDESWAPNPSPHSDECMANGGVMNMNFAADSNTMPVLRVKWSSNCSIPFHYHPTGAMYFILYGNMYFAGDFTDGDKKLSQADTRWVRPGFAYGPEYNDDAPMEITVFGTDTPPEFSDPPAGPYKVQKSVQVTHVYDHQPGTVPHNTSEVHEL